MRKRASLWGFAALAILLATFGIPRSRAYISASLALYLHAAPSTMLHSFPGHLQTADLTCGNCPVDRGRGGCLYRGECTIKNPVSGKLEKGTCTPSADKKSCYCLVK